MIKEKCLKCRRTGRFAKGRCFKCDGTGELVFAIPAEERARNREFAARRQKAKKRYLGVK